MDALGLLEHPEHAIHRFRGPLFSRSGTVAGADVRVDVPSNNVLQPGFTWPLNATTFDGFRERMTA